MALKRSQGRAARLARMAAGVCMASGPPLGVAGNATAIAWKGCAMVSMRSHVPLAVWRLCESRHDMMDSSTSSGRSSRLWQLPGRGVGTGGWLSWPLSSLTPSALRPAAAAAMGPGALRGSRPSTSSSASSLPGGAWCWPSCCRARPPAEMTVTAGLGLPGSTAYSSVEMMPTASGPPLCCSCSCMGWSAGTCTRSRPWSSGCSSCWGDAGAGATAWSPAVAADRGEGACCLGDRSSSSSVPADATLGKPFLRAASMVGVNVMVGMKIHLQLSLY
mmetsp:Transcript_31148/g.79432  ORF Transcript_31148/g.79432 Transcript_31148/m.79432 type:complete len:275 (+) Transcript_31148:1294-2118(+)